MDKDKRTDEDEFEVTDSEPADETEIEDIEELGAQKIKKLQAKLKECEAEKMKHLEDLQRTKADYLNSRKRLEDQLRRDAERVTESHLLSLLPLADSFEMAMQDPAWKDCDEKWRKGVEGIHGQLNAILKAHGVTRIDAAGVAFNPHEHEAVSNEPVTTDKDIDTVVRVLQTGYRRNDAVLRPARVVVGITE
ncbi:MAG: nucleotide exchange factor GrpE [Candidatus Paceibacterota bacterium]